jgi:hypothetical protein
MPTNLVSPVQNAPPADADAMLLSGIEHFAMPTKNITGLERFVREILGGIPYYYAGYDEIDRKMGRKPHIFMRVGKILFQCTEESGPMHPRKGDSSVSPHWAFGIMSGQLDSFRAHLDSNGLPYHGPHAQPQFGVRSIYFMSPESHKLEVCEPVAPGSPGGTPLTENLIEWAKLENNWVSQRASVQLRNIKCVFGEREARDDNVSGLTHMHHFTLPVKDPTPMRRFLVDLLDAMTWSGGRKPSAAEPLRIGETGFECTRDPNSPLYPVPGDDNISPHCSFGASASALDSYQRKLQAVGIPVAGPYRHRALDLVSIYFKSPEGHKFEIGTWEPYPEAKAALMGAPGVGFIPWSKMDHQWRP